MRAGAIFFCAVALLIAGCAEVPRPTTLRVVNQGQLQSAMHWQLMARENAERVNDALSRLIVKDGIAPVIFVGMDDKSPFGVAFREYLITELMQINPRFLISNDPGQPFHITWNTQLVYRDAERIKPEGLFETVGESLWQFFTGLRWTTYSPLVSHAELIHTTMITKDKLDLARYSDTYYVNDTDLINYDYRMAAPGGIHPRSIAAQDEAWRMKLALEGRLPR